MWLLLGSIQYNIIERRILYCMRDLVKELEQAVYNRKTEEITNAVSDQYFNRFISDVTEMLDEEFPEDEDPVEYLKKVLKVYFDMAVVQGFHIGHVMGSYSTADKLLDVPMVYNFDYRDYLEDEVDEEE